MDEKDSILSELKIVIKWGKPVLQLTFSKIKLIATTLAILLIIIIIFSIKLFVSAVQIRTHIGYFINMISTGDGDVLPSLQAVPVLFCLLLNIAICYLLYNAFDPHERPMLNRFMFVIILAGIVLILVIFVIIISVIAHAYSAHISLHDGIVEAMNNYSSNLKSKTQIDKLQIEFQCCGSKKYDEWYSIVWLDPTLHKEDKANQNDGNTPFSCCSMKSLTPCIHHDIELTGEVYLYTPEYNLSISTRGCYDILRERKQSIGWTIVGNLFLYIVLQAAIVILFRLIQTTHFLKMKYDGNRREYTGWLIGIYKGRVKKSDAKAVMEPLSQPPSPPPVPPELME